MTVKIINDDVFKHFDSNTILVHGCNAQHVMGSGVAALVRRHFPEAYGDYMGTAQLKLGDVIFTKVSGDNRWIANAITQEFFGRTGGPFASVDAIRSALEKVKQFKINCKVIMPEIGCGLGGLSKQDVYPVVQEVFCDEQACEIYVL